MRTYPSNSPQAAARIVALTLLADGHFSGAEYAALSRNHAAQSLGLSEVDIHDVVQHLVEDLLACGGSSWSGTGLLDESFLLGLLREVTDPRLHVVVLDICTAVVGSDAHPCDLEQGVLEVVRRAWHQDRAAATAVH